MPTGGAAELPSVGGELGEAARSRFARKNEAEDLRRAFDVLDTKKCAADVASAAAAGRSNKGSAETLTTAHLQGRRH